MSDKSPRYPVWAVGTTAVILLFIVALVVFTIRTLQVHFDLVSPDYYAQELAYQDRIDAASRAEALPEKPVIETTAEGVRVVLPETVSRQLTAGSLVLYRPSNARYDTAVSLESGATHILVPWTNKPSGNWKVKLTWTMGDEAYYIEQAVYR